MDMREELAEEKLLVQSYGDGGFRVGGTRIEGAMLISANLADNLKLNSIADLNAQHLQEIIDTLGSKKEIVEVILFGCGENIQALPAQCTKWLVNNNIAYDMMDTGAAARTYNVLQSENRRAVAILLPVS